MVPNAAKQIRYTYYNKTIILSNCRQISKKPNLWLNTGSNPTVGSSSINIIGLCKRATPNDTLLCCPPLKNVDNKNKTNTQSSRFRPVFKL